MSVARISVGVITILFTIMIWYTNKRRNDWETRLYMSDIVIDTMIGGFVFGIIIIQLALFFIE